MPPTRPRSSAAQPTWAPTNVVRRVAREQPVEATQQLVEPGIAGAVGVVDIAHGRPEVPVGMLAQLLPALVRPIQRIEERDRVRHVDDHRHAQVGGCPPQRVEPRIVHAAPAGHRGLGRPGPGSSRPSARARHGRPSRAAPPPPAHRSQAPCATRRSPGRRRWRTSTGGILDSARPGVRAHRPGHRPGRPSTRSPPGPSQRSSSPTGRCAQSPPNTGPRCSWLLITGQRGCSTRVAAVRSARRGWNARRVRSGGIVGAHESRSSTE